MENTNVYGRFNVHKDYKDDNRKNIYREDFSVHP